MGVPKFYRWLSERYPLINQAIDESTLIPEVDNLYLDMNGLIHGATHGNEGVSRKVTEKEVMLSMIAYIDSMVKLTKPLKLLYLAVDGVAPRAKMNQQRSRRFRSARDQEEARAEARARGEEIADDDVFDSNCITPGTEFMSAISSHLRYFIRRKMKEDPAWQRFRVVFSGHEVPGEGEHKIVQFIRGVKMTREYDPNTRHCMAGLDADLIMLALATHEPHFMLLREQVDFGAFRANKFGTKTKTRSTAETKWQMLHVGLLREYLEIDMRPAAMTGSAGGAAGDGSGGGLVYDGERVIDDFVLMMTLCGNDFLPHLPSLDIGEGAVDLLLRTYREYLPRWGGYLCDSGLIHLDRFEALLGVMGACEEEVFRTRADDAAKWERKMRREAQGNGRGGGGGGGGYHRRGGRRNDEDEFDEADAQAAADQAAADAAMLAELTNRLALQDAGIMTGGAYDNVLVDEDGNEIRPPPSPALAGLASPGGGGGEGGRKVTFKERYYFDKFGVSSGLGIREDEAVLRQLIQSYVEALQWVLLCASWGWFYPFHYAPMTSDLKNLKSYRVSFRLGQPFLPFQQLLGCLPAASAKFLPACYRHLMTDEASPLKHYYPPVEEIKVDMNGKRNPWEGVTLIPFIKENEMLDAITRFCPDSAMGPDERRRNAFGSEYLFVYDPSVGDTVPSSMPGTFPDIHACQTVMRPHRMPPMPVLTTADVDAVLAAEGAAAELVDATRDIVVGASSMRGAAGMYSARPRPGCVVPAPGFPTLHTLAFTPLMVAVRMNVFGMPSKKDSLVLALGDARGAPGRRGKARHPLDFIESDDEDEDDEGEAGEGEGVQDDGDAFLAAAAAALPTMASGSGASSGNAIRPRAPRLLPPHSPKFSTAYAPGTTVADAQTGNVPRDVLSLWRSSAGKRQPPPHLSARSLAPFVLGRVFYVEWPHLREALVTTVSDGEEEVVWTEGTGGLPEGHPLRVNGGVLTITPHSPDACVQWSRDASGLQEDLLAGRRALGIAGVKVHRVDVVLGCQKLVGMRRDPATGALHRVWGARGSPAEIRIVPELLLPAHPTPDGRFAEQGPQGTPQRFPVGEKVMVLRGPQRGCVGLVTGYVPSPGGADAAGSAAGAASSLALEVIVPPRETPFGHTIASTIKDTYFDARRACSALQLSPSSLGRVTGSVMVMPAKIDLGLNLKVRRNLYLPGYVRPMAAEAQAPAWCSGADASRTVASSGPLGPGGGPSGPWEYTERSLHLVAAYQRAWPTVFALLETQPNESAYDTAVFPGGAETVLKIATWLQQLDTYKRPLVPITTQFMSPSAIAAVEKAADTFSAMAAKRPDLTKRAAVPCVGPTDVYKPELLSYAVGSVGEGQGTALVSGNVDGSSAMPVLGDRVANLSFKQAPLGLKGTVVAIHSATGFVEVVFDGEFIGGTSLGGLCSNGRGALLPWSALLCLSRAPSSSESSSPSGAPSAAAGSAGAAGRAATTGTDEDVIARLEGMPRGKRGPGAQQQQQAQGRVPTPVVAAPAPAPAAAGGGSGRGASGGGGKAAASSAPKQPFAGPGPAFVAASSPASSSSSTGTAAPSGAKAGGPKGAPVRSASTAASSAAALVSAPAPAVAAGTSIPVSALFGGEAGLTSAPAPAPVRAPPEAAAAAPALDLPAVARQVEFYFSDGNLARDAFMAHLVRSAEAGSGGWVGVASIRTFKRMVELAGGDADVIAAAVGAHSKSLLVSPDGKGVKRAVPWPGAAPPAPAAAAPPAPAPAPYAQLQVPGRMDPLSYYASMMTAAAPPQAQGQASAPIPAAAAAAAVAGAATGPSEEGSAGFSAMMSKLQRGAAAGAIAGSAPHAGAVGGPMMPMGPGGTFPGFGPPFPMGGPMGPMTMTGQGFPQQQPGFPFPAGPMMVPPHPGMMAPPHPGMMMAPQQWQQQQPMMMPPGPPMGRPQQQPLPPVPMPPAAP